MLFGKREHTLHVSKGLEREEDMTQGTGGARSEKPAPEITR